MQGTVAERLAKPVQYLKGVGSRLASVLDRLELRTARDVLFFFPRDYEDIPGSCPIEELDGTQPVTVSGTIEEAELRDIGGGRSVLGVLVRGVTEYLRAVWFNQPYMQRRMVVGRRVLLSGTPRRRGLCWQMSHPRIEILDDDQVPTGGRILPIYPLTEGLHQTRMRRIVNLVVDEYAGQIEDVFPDAYREQRGLFPIETALREIHNPTNRESLDAARHRFVYQELLVLQLAIALRRRALQEDARAPALPATAKIDARIQRLFPFELTADQQTAIREIAEDMAQTMPMNRLLQGEVGSGKTVVAEYTMLLAVAHGCQAVLMAPTELLARQHWRVLSHDLRQSRVRMELMTGALTASRRATLLRAVANGEVDLLIGTQALLNDKIEFQRLGLVVIDEQHKFGVRQRAALKQSATTPHYLVMTATPIPRTVMMTLFGDLDVSTLSTSPPGRQQVHTYLGSEQQRSQWWAFFCKKLREGRQGYVVVPRVIDDESEEVASVQQVFEQLANGPLEAFRVDLIHGRMPSSEKEAVMQSFRRGRVQVLVGTSVIEVGVDVPNATLMTIENGERFGLAQLHQLRGRICRGNFPGYVCVFTCATHDDARTRLDAFARSSDGFELAEVDFASRGPGEVFGTRQHGVPALRVADIARDQDVLQEARHDARQLALSSDLIFQQPFSLLHNMTVRRYGKKVMDEG